VAIRQLFCSGASSLASTAAHARLLHVPMDCSVAGSPVPHESLLRPTADESLGSLPSYRHAEKRSRSADGPESVAAKPSRPQGNLVLEILLNHLPFPRSSLVFSLLLAKHRSIRSVSPFQLSCVRVQIKRSLRRLVWKKSPSTSHQPLP
jgi:hypothetical protein